ncbi:MAG: hypothetical protein KJN62_00430 [Deltaproteobacteria bacterium]|nr:hypothetical protein [Deltaproteobacteria bacterium]
MKKFLTILILLALYGCPSGGDTPNHILQPSDYHAYSMEFTDKCNVIEPWTDGYLVDCQEETWFIETSLVAKAQDEFTIMFVFGSLDNGLYELLDMLVVDHYSW